MDGHLHMENKQQLGTGIPVVYVEYGFEVDAHIAQVKGESKPKSTKKQVLEFKLEYIFLANKIPRDDHYHSASQNLREGAEVPLVPSYQGEMLCLWQWYTLGGQMYTTLRVSSCTGRSMWRSGWRNNSSRRKMQLKENGTRLRRTKRTL